MLKPIALLVVCFLISINTFAQGLTVSELTGKWRVVKAESSLGDVIPAELKGRLDSLTTTYLTSTFEFKEDGNFNFNFEIADMSITNAHWKIDKKTKSVIIQEWADKDKAKSILMEITIRKEGDKIFFQPIEAFIDLEMKKE